MTDITLTKNDLGKVHYLDFQYGSSEAATFFTNLSKQIEELSDHHSYKVGAIAYGVDKNGKTFYVPSVNTIPDPLKEHFNTHDKLGDGHPSIHAEMMAMLTLPQFEKASFALSKSPCPTCFEGMSEIRNFKPHNGLIDTVYYDGESLQSAEAQKKWKIAEAMLKTIGKRGRIGLCEVNLNTDEIATITTYPTYSKMVNVENPITIMPIDDIDHLEEADIPRLMGLASNIAKSSTLKGNKEAALALGRNREGKHVIICAAASLPPGFSELKNGNLQAFDEINGKSAYNYKLSAAKRVMMAAVKEGIELQNGSLICTTVPISGMLINATAYGLSQIILPEGIKLDTANNMDHKALQQLGIRRIIHVIETPTENVFLDNQRSFPNKIRERELELDFE